MIDSPTPLDAAWSGWCFPVRVRPDRYTARSMGLGLVAGDDGVPHRAPSLVHERLDLGELKIDARRGLPRPLLAIPSTRLDREPPFTLVPEGLFPLFGFR